MKRIYYYKLIRDGIPAKITAAGSQYEAYRLNAKDFEVELFKKLGEEASGLIGAETKEAVVSELADVMAVIDEIKKLKKIESSAIKRRQIEHQKTKGGFKQRLFLVWSSNDKYRTNERKYKKHRGGK